MEGPSSTAPPTKFVIVRKEEADTVLIVERVRSGSGILEWKIENVVVTRRASSSTLMEVVTMARVLPDVRIRKQAFLK